MSRRLPSGLVILFSYTIINQFNLYICWVLFAFSAAGQGQTQAAKVEKEKAEAPAVKKEAWAWLTQLRV